MIYTSGISLSMVLTSPRFEGIEGHTTIIGEGDRHTGIRSGVGDGSGGGEEAGEADDGCGDLLGAAATQRRHLGCQRFSS